jgi:saccharopine dehydrogenase (NAD+, L-lysine-forming)
MKRILVVGGYGEVGSKVVLSLIALGHTSISIAGRSPLRGQAFIKKLNLEQISFIPLDTSSPDFAKLNDIDLIILCLEQKDPTFFKNLLLLGKTVIDISANDNLHQEIEAFTNYSGHALLSVGLAPGLTNLLVKKMVMDMPKLSFAEIGIILGSGDNHGPQAIQWTIDNLVHNPSPRKKTFSFLGSWSKRKVFSFPFSDQFSLKRSLKIEVSTYLGLSPSLMSILVLDWSAKLPRALMEKIKPILYFISQRPIGKDDRFVIQANGYKNNIAVPNIMIQLEGRNEARITAHVAAIMALQTLKSIPPQGTFHIHELYQWEDIWPVLQKLNSNLLKLSVQLKEE